ncbi:MAG: glycosyltransferase family 87 protein [Janthinobacterium lividum]
MQTLLPANDLSGGQRGQRMPPYEPTPYAAPRTTDPVRLPRSVQFFWLITLAVWGAALLFAVWGRRAGLPQTRWDPLSDPLLGDLMEYPATYRLLHSPAFFNGGSPRALPAPMFSAVAYPPFAAAMLAPLYRAVSPVWSFLFAALAWLAVALQASWSFLRQQGLSPMLSAALPLSLLITSFPVARLVHQGNVELVVWILVAAGSWAFLRGYNQAAAVIWGLAGATKLYPASLLLLLLPRRRLDALLLGVAAGIGTTWMSLWWLGPTVATAWQGSLHNVFGYQDLRAAEWSLRELTANHSWFNWVKLLALLLHVPGEDLLLPYLACGAILFVWALRRLWSMPAANQLLAVTTFMVALPSVSYFHTLVHLYVPLLVLTAAAIRAQARSTALRGLQMTLLLFVPLFTPYTLLLSPQIFIFCGLTQSLVLLLLFLCALEFPFELLGEISC